MATISGKLAKFNPYSSDAVVPSAYSIGQRVQATNGREFMYVKAGASTLVAGNLLQAAATDTQFNAMSVIAAAIQTGGQPQQVTVTNGTTTIAANDFDGGSLVVDTTPDVGSEYTIISHTTGASGAAIILTLDHPLGTAWSTATKVTMKRNPAAGVIQGVATTPTGIAVGVAVYAIPAANFGWIQTKGLCSVLSDGTTFAIGSEVGTASGTAGSVTVYAAGTGHEKVGRNMQANSNGHNISIYLDL